MNEFVNDYIEKNKEKILDRILSENKDYSKYTHEEILNSFCSRLDMVDPHPRKKYTKWVLFRYANGKMGTMRNVSDVIVPLLEFHYRLFNRKVLKSFHRDINAFRSGDDFVSVMETYKDMLKYEMSEITPRLESDNVEVLIDDDRFLVVMPKTVEAATFFGNLSYEDGYLPKDSEWCTAWKGGTNRFKEYADKKIYIILDKANKTRYQFCPESGEFANESNRHDLFYLVDVIAEGKPVFDLFVNCVEFYGNALYFPIRKFWVHLSNDWKQVHCDYGPAKIIDKENEKIVEWYRDGKLHREDGPARIEIKGEGRIEAWYYDGLFHRDGDNPTWFSQFRNEDGDRKSVVEWAKNGYGHRDNGPNYISINHDRPERNILMWKRKGEYHRLDGPAYIDNFCNTTRWYRNGILHRNYGPAITDGVDKKDRAWFKNGECTKVIGFRHLLEMGDDTIDSVTRKIKQQLLLQEKL